VISGARAGEDSPDASPAETGREDGFGDSGLRSAGVVDDPAVARELADLREAVEAQNERLERQQRTIQQLIEELRQGR
jgi:hypothetical protein